EDADKKDSEEFDSWSKDRAKELAKENGRINDRTFNAITTGFGNDWFSYDPFRSRRAGVWYYSLSARCYTFIPYSRRCGSPYGGGYSRSIFASGFGGWSGQGTFGGPIRPGF